MKSEQTQGIKFILVFASLALLAGGNVSCGKLKGGKQGLQSESVAEPALPPESAPATSPDTTAASGDASAKTPAPTMDLTGKDLYAKLCASCHNPLEQNDIGKTSIDVLKQSIIDVAGMQSLKTVSAKDLGLIVDAINAVAPGKGKGKNMQ